MDSTLSSSADAAETKASFHELCADMQHELDLAAKVHRTLLPTAIRHDRIWADVRYTPFNRVGGDYCQVRLVDESTCYITMCDVTGHSIGAALLATRVSSEVRHLILRKLEPCEIVKTLNAFIRNFFTGTDLYLSFIAARIDLAEGRITWSGAGHPSPVLIRAGAQAVEKLESQNMLVGVQDAIMEDEPQHTLPIDSGDRLLFYTDGISETVDADNRQLGTDRLAEIAADAIAVGLFDALDHLLEMVDRYQHGAVRDDKTLIMAELR